MTEASSVNPNFNAKISWKACNNNTRTIYLQEKQSKYVYSEYADEGESDKPKKIKTKLGSEMEPGSCLEPPSVIQEMDPARQNFGWINVQGALYNTKNDMHYRDRECFSFTILKLPVTGTGDNNDVGNDGDGDEIDVPPPQNVNMDTLAGQFLLNNDKIPDSVKANLEDPESTASEALDWVLNDPANAVEYPFDAEGTFDNVLAQIDLTQRLALASIAKSMTVNPDNNWMSEEDVCDWEGIVCGNPDDGAGVEQVAGNIITEIKLNEAEMEGTIPAEIALLPDLERLSFWNNKLSGPIPAELGSMPNLVYIDFDDNELTGQIPPEIFTDRLVDVFLSKNQLTGPIPATVGEMTNVEIVWLNNNGLEGGIPDEMGDLQNLKELFLDSNPIFDGLDDPSFPDALKGLGSLVTLNMRNMLMGGPFPQFEAGDFPNLQTLQLDDNLLTGEISDRGIGNLASLVDLSLARNAGLGGDLPLDIQDWDALQFLDLSNCSFQNEIPKEIGMAESLKEVYLNGNELVGELPGAITWLENLDTFVVSDNLDITGLHKAICREMQKLDEPYTLEIGCNVECECCSDVCDA